ncbi:sigma-70 family RNA polymerase sigma factor [Roseivirga sp.]|uniref:sigma-70 family RNA polymerase sigma factor n=1 Tax=Roseivirga sp. TaxID=1964215 RepID=UPI003B8CCBFD
MNPHCQVVAPVFQEYSTKLTRFINSRVSDPVDSEELLSTIMMKIFDHCEKLEKVKNTEAWLIAIARNTITDYFREQQKGLGKHSSQEFVLEETNDPYQDLEACVPSLIQKLPDKYAKPLADYELKGIPQKQLAIKYGLSESGLKSRIQRGRKMLKTMFIEYCGHLVLEVGCEGCNDC